MNQTQMLETNSNPYHGPTVIEVAYLPVVARPLYTPLNKVAKDYAVLMKKKNFSRRDVVTLRNMGITVTITQQTDIPTHLL